MAGKRVATTVLNSDNWDREEDADEAGTFKKATDEALQSRVIKVARRRNPIGVLAAAEGENKSIFGNFSGFNKPTATTSMPQFGFLSTIATTKTTEEQSKTNGISNILTNTVSSIMKSEVKLSTVEVDAKETTSSKSNEYYAKLKGLNESVSNWIKKHVDANPLINLVPIFRDYEKHLEELEKSSKLEKDNARPTTQPAVSIFKSPTFDKKPQENEPNVDLTSFVFKVPEKTNTSPLVKPVPTTSSSSLSFTPVASSEPPKFNFGFVPTTLPSTQKSFTFDSSVPTTSGFSFGGANSKPFTFTNVNKPADTEASSKTEDDDEPPKVEFTPVVEKDSLYTIRCKVFVKKDGNYGDRGVGNLYLKAVPNSEKIQLIVRADTSLGNLLCNFLLTESMPVQRMGKKDVMLVCLPTPESKPPPTPILLRVKSTEEADELLKILEKHKK